MGINRLVCASFSFHLHKLIASNQSNDYESVCESNATQFCKYRGKNQNPAPPITIRGPQTARRHLRGKHRRYGGNKLGIKEMGPGPAWAREQTALAMPKGLSMLSLTMTYPHTQNLHTLQTHPSLTLPPIPFFF